MWLCTRVAQLIVLKFTRGFPLFSEASQDGLSN